MDLMWHQLLLCQVITFIECLSLPAQLEKRSASLASHLPQDRWQVCCWPMEALEVFLKPHSDCHSHMHFADQCSLQPGAALERVGCDQRAYTTPDRYASSRACAVLSCSQVGHKGHACRRLAHAATHRHQWCCQSARPGAHSCSHAFNAYNLLATINIPVSCPSSPCPHCVLCQVFINPRCTFVVPRPPRQLTNLQSPPELVYAGGRRLEMICAPGEFIHLRARGSRVGSWHDSGLNGDISAVGNVSRSYRALSLYCASCRALVRSLGLGMKPLTYRSLSTQRMHGQHHQAAQRLLVLRNGAHAVSMIRHCRCAALGDAAAPSSATTGPSAAVTQQQQAAASPGIDWQAKRRKRLVEDIYMVSSSQCCCLGGCSAYFLVLCYPPASLLPTQPSRVWIFEAAG